MAAITKVLVANRGEIAVRVIRACRALGIETVLAASEADRDSLPARMADRTLCIGPAPSSSSYLNVGTIVEAALGSGSDAIHPGYGFLAERPELSQACIDNGIVFIGPNPRHIRTMGDKLAARQAAAGLRIPVVPGSELIDELSKASATAEEVGYPILLKAAAGGGGKGMKTVHRPDDLEAVYREAAAEARSAFGDDRLYLESFVPNARHVEVQVLGDSHGNSVHLFERDCSVQRRYQKLIEEAPAPGLSGNLRERLCQAALGITEAIRYENAGTVEFIVDQDKGTFYFLEMNTRIQVEHPVTEMTTGIRLGAGADKGGAGRLDQLFAGPGKRQGPRHRMPHQRRAALGRLPAVARTHHAMGAAGRAGHPGGQPLLCGLHRPAVLRLPSGQADC